MIAPNRVYLNAPDTLVAVRELLSQYPGAASCGPEEIAALVYDLYAAPHRPEVLEVEAALDALRIEDEVLA